MNKKVFAVLTLIVFSLSVVGVGGRTPAVATNLSSNQLDRVVTQSTIDTWIANPESMSVDALSRIITYGVRWSNFSADQSDFSAVQLAASGQATPAPTVEATAEPTAEATAQPTTEPTVEATAEPSQSATTTAPAQPTPAQLEAVYNAVWQRINDTYYDAAPLEKFQEWKDKYAGKLNTIPELEDALKAMVGSLHDHWTSYTPRPELVKQYNQYVSGVVDLGMALQKSGSTYKVWYVFYGGPAWTSDIRRGDTILSIDGKEIGPLSQDEVDALLLRQKGTTIDVVDRHAGITETVSLTAAETAPDQVVSQIFPTGIAYIRFPNFSDAQIYSDFRQQLAQMYLSSPTHFKALLLDLRGNPGGEVQEAISFVSLFLKHGAVMNEVTRSGRFTTSSRLLVNEPMWNGVGDAADFYKFLESVPMYVLVDENSASAAELTTGALKDNRRAVILGQTTWGKGVGYEVWDQQSGSHQILPTGGILQITTLQYTTPNGTQVQGVGVHPNVLIAQPRNHTSDVQLQRTLRFIAGVLASQ